MKSMEKSLKLRNDRVLVVARIADQRAAAEILFVRAAQVRRRCVARQIARTRIAAGQLFASKKSSIGIVHIRLIGRAAAIDIVQVEGRRAEIRQRVEIVLLLQTAGRIEGDIVIDELAEIGIQRRNAAFFFVWLFVERFELRGHGRPQGVQILFDDRIDRSERRSRQMPEHSSEPSLERWRTPGGGQPPGGGGMRCRHDVLLSRPVYCARRSVESTTNFGYRNVRETHDRCEKRYFNVSNASATVNPDPSACKMTGFSSNSAT